MPTKNVKDDYGAVGDGTTNDTTAIQNAFDAAFGTSGSPHGTNTALNYDVYFPPGRYKTFGNTLTQVKSGRIYSDGIGGNGAGIVAGTGSISIFNINGFSNSTIEGLGFTGTGPAGGVIGINLDWDGTNPAGSVGLGNNTFKRLSSDSTQTFVKVGASGNGGNDNLFESCITGNCGRCIWLAGTGATDQDIIGGGFADSTGTAQLWAEHGNFGFLRGVQLSGHSANDVDILIDGGGSTTIMGLRSESARVVSISNGRLTMRGCLHSGNADAQTRYFLNMTSASANVQIDACIVYINQVPNGIQGTAGNLWIRNLISTNAGAIQNVGPLLANFTGTLHYFRCIQSTVANLPSPALTNMEAIVTDGSGTPTLDSTVAGGGAGKFLVRYNGSNWVVKGK